MSRPSIFRLCFPSLSPKRATGAATEFPALAPATPLPRWPCARRCGRGHRICRSDLYSCRLGPSSLGFQALVGDAVSLTAATASLNKGVSDLSSSSMDLGTGSSEPGWCGGGAGWRRILVLRLHRHNGVCSNAAAEFVRLFGSYSRRSPSGGVGGGWKSAGFTLGLRMVAGGSASLHRRRRAEAADPESGAGFGASPQPMCPKVDGLSSTSHSRGP